MATERRGVGQEPGDHLPGDLAGKQVGNYVLQDLLGQGGFGSVYRAEHPQIGRQVAIKLLDRPLSGPDAGRFMDEARAAASIRHPNIIDIYDFGQSEEGWPYAVMELLEGRSLEVLLRERPGAEGRMSLAELLPLVEQICAGLQAAHDMGVVHRDLTPGNIFLLDGPAPNVKILDFGIAKLLEREAQGRSRTATGLVMGTPLYMAPEQAAGEVRGISPQTDLYTLGIILYQALGGVPPFDHESVRKLLFMQMYEDAPPLGEVVADLPAGVAGVVMQCLEKGQGLRPGSAAEVAARFAEQASGGRESTLSYGTQGPGAGEEPAAGRRPGAWVALALVGAALAGLVLWFMVQGAGEESPQQRPVSGPAAELPPLMSPEPPVDGGRPDMAAAAAPMEPDGGPPLPAARASVSARKKPRRKRAPRPAVKRSPTKAAGGKADRAAKAAAPAAGPLGEGVVPSLPPKKKGEEEVLGDDMEDSL